MNATTPPFYILAGPPGAGKTTLLNALSGHVRTVSEPARRVLANQRANGGRGTGDQDSEHFVRLMTDAARADYETASGLTLFDRGLPDLLAFHAWYKLPDTALHPLIRSHRYANPIFWLPAWEEIYEKDDERTLDFAGAKVFGDFIYEGYRASGYDFVIVPKAPLEQRIAFILDKIRR